MFPHLSKVLNEVNSRKAFYTCNMYVIRKPIYDDYHNMLFCVLEEFDKHIELSVTDSIEPRVFVFLSERFLNYYIEWVRKTKKINIKELGILFIPSDLH